MTCRSDKARLEANASSLAQFALAGALVTAVVVSCGPPETYYVKTQFMRRFGEETRERTGRAIGETVVPPAAQLPVVVPIAVDPDEPSGLFPASDHVRVAQASPIDVESRPESSAVVPIDVDRTRLAEILRTRHEVGVVDAKAINGRFTGGENLLRVEFVPRSRDEAVVQREFLLICAVVVGMDRSGTVDAVVGLATDTQLMPWMSLRADLRVFEAYQSGELSLDEWQARIETRRL